MTARPERLVLVTGTGTEVGKTWVACRLARALRGRGLIVAAGLTGLVIMMGPYIPLDGSYWEDWARLDDTRHLPSLGALMFDLAPQFRFLVRERWRPNADVYETARTIEMTVDLAGVADEDFEIQLFANALVVEGVRRLPSAREDAVYHAAGIRQGPFRVELPLPAGGLPQLAIVRYVERAEGAMPSLTGIEPAWIVEDAEAELVPFPPGCAVPAGTVPLALAVPGKAGWRLKTKRYRLVANRPS